MGPRFFKRGDQWIRDWTFTETMLQWGHASLSVETTDATAPPR